MTVSSSTNRDDYSGNGSTVNFSVNFRFLANSHVKVILTSAIGVETVQVETTNYTLTGAGADSGGTLTMLVAPATGETLTILRNVPFTQETDYVENDAFPAESHEQALDKLTMLVQQQQEELDRSLKLTESQQSSGLTIPSPINNNLLRWDTNGDLVNVTEQQLGTVAEEDLIKEFGTVALMKADTSLINGRIVDTSGYIASGDGGGARYLIQTAAEFGGTPDEFGDHTLSNGNIAVLQNYSGNILQYGVSVNNVDNSDAMQAALNANSDFVVPETAAGTQLWVKSTLYPSNGQRISGTGLIKAAADWTADNWYLNFSAEQIKSQIIFLCDGVEDVEIKDVQLDVSNLSSLASHVRKTVVFFHYEVGVYKERFRARNVRSVGAGIAAYCNVQDVLVEDCNLINDAVSPLISFETIYPNSGAAPYQYPIECKAINNTLDNPVSVEDTALVWLSGAKDILLRGNTIKGKGDLIQIYVNDLKVGMENCVIDANNLHQYATTLNDRSPVNVMGKSFIDPGGSHTFEMSDVVISRNRFTTDTDYSAQTTSKPSIVSAIMAGNIKVWGNKASNYYYGASFTDHFSTTYVRRSTPEIYDNEFTELADKPVRWVDTLESTVVRGNYFKNWGKQLTTFATRTCLDFTRIRNVYVTGNRFVSDDAVTRERIYDLDQCVNCVIGDNEYASNHNALLTAGGLDNSGYIFENIIDETNSGRKRFTSAGRNPLGVFSVGDVNDYSFSPFVSGPNSYVQQVCTTAGTTPGGAYTETATGTAANDFFTASSLSGLLRVNQGVTIDGNAYTITDIDYYDQKFFVSPVLATTFSSVAITATTATVWKDTAFYV